MVFFSIIIPVFNAESFISFTLKNILEQSFKDFEIILVDDASDDNTRVICKGFKKNNGNIKIIENKKNLGVGHSRNIGLQNSSGKYIIFIDSDDGLFRNALLKLKLEILNKSKPDIIVVQYKKNTYPYSNSKFILDNINNNNTKELIKYLKKTRFPFADCWSFVCKSSFIFKNKIFFPQIRIGESELFVAKLVCYMRSFIFMPSNFYKKNDRDFSLNHTQGYNVAEAKLILLIEFVIFNKKQKLNKFKYEFIETYIQDCFGILSSSLILLNYKELKKLSKIIDKNKKYLKGTNKFPEKIRLYNLVAELGAYQGLLSFRKKIVSGKLKKFKNLLFNSSKIYVYCRHKYTKATIKILTTNGYKVQGVIDDTEIYNSTDFLNFKTINLKTFLIKECKNINNISIIITHQKDKTLEKIFLNLLKVGFSSSQIVKIKY